MHGPSRSVLAAAWLCAVAIRAEPGAMTDWKLLPYPQSIERLEGEQPLGPAVLHGAATPVIAECLRRVLPATGPPLAVRLSLADDLGDGLPGDEAYRLRIDTGGVSIAARTPRGLLHGVQTLVQLAREAGRRGVGLPHLLIRDYPAMPWRCLSPTMTWYSGWNRLEGYDLCNWTLDEWKWLVDWTLEHKLNAWALCLYGYWPFTLPGHDEATLAVSSFRLDPVTGEKVGYRFVHRNIEREFLPELIAYAHERGIQIHAYLGLNSFNGGYIIHHPEANAGGAAEALPFAPGVTEYWDAVIARLLELGFDGFVFEDPEAYHVPNQNAGCWETFWRPWAEMYGFRSVEETNANEPPLGVHVEYYAWLFRQFDASIQRHAARLGRVPEIRLISHFLLSRLLREGGSDEEVARWYALLDEKRGRAVDYIVAEGDEPRDVALLGGSRVASLGGRGGSCLSAWRRMTGVNNNAVPGPMGASIDWERDCQRRAHRAGAVGALAYVFEWRSNEVYGYLGAQHLWRPDGVPGIDNEDQVGFLDYAYRVHYGDEVGALAARALDTSACVNDAMVLEEVHGAQYPETGRALHRDYQLLATQAEQAESLARAAYRAYTSREPDLLRPDYAPDDFRWSGSAADDRRLKAESLRWLCVQMRRASLLCDAALAHRRAARDAAAGLPARMVAGQLDRAVAAVAENQRLYQLNHDDDFHANEGLCVTLTERLRALRRAVGEGEAPVPEADREGLTPALALPWRPIEEILPAADGPGRYLEFDLGLSELRDPTCHAVVFTLEADGVPVFRRILDKNHRGWETWRVPLAGATRLRLLTDAYTRAQRSEALGWRWALWGEPRLVEVGAGGAATVVAALADARSFIRLDATGLEAAMDPATGAAWEPVAPGRMAALRAGELAARQWFEGFAGDAAAAHQGPYPCYLGAPPSWWGYAREQGRVAWTTVVPPERRDSAVVWIGGTDYTPGTAELWLDGERLLAFSTGSTTDAVWAGGGAELRYLHGGDTRDERIPYGLSGAFVLLLPADRLTAGAPLRLEVRMLTGGQAWFMLHGVTGAVAAADGVAQPAPARPAILAVPPHRGGHGIVGADYLVPAEN